MHLGFVFLIEKGIVRYCSRRVSEVMPFVLELRKDWKRGSKGMKGMDILREDGVIFAPSIPLIDY